MTNTLYKVQRRDDPSKVIECTWQNASELVSHGHWQWADGGTGSKQFSKAQKEAKVKNTKPDGFEHLEEVQDGGDEDDDDDRGSDDKSSKPVIPVTQVARTKVAEKAPKDGYEDMSRDELFEEAVKRGFDPDKRLGTKNLISLLRKGDA